MMHLEAFKMTAQILNFEIPGLKSKYLNLDCSSETLFYLSMNKLFLHIMKIMHFTLTMKFSMEKLLSSHLKFNHLV